MIARTPPMGWNSWDCYGAAVTEETVRKNADYMKRHLAAYGWEYVVVDIQWYQPTAVNHQYEPFSSLTMDDCGRLLPAVNRFPSADGGAGFKPLADYVHSLGLKFGIHIMRGVPRMAAHLHLPIAGSAYGCHEAADPSSICAWNPDMYGTRADHPAARAYYESLFGLYAQWGVDYVKCDDIAREYPRCAREIELIHEACRGCGREMVLSLSPGPAPLERAEHLKRNANLWRITDDFWDEWRLLLAMFERAEKWCIHSGPGHWPDADMLPVGALRQCDSQDGWTRLTHAEQRTMMTLWAMMRSPLMIGAELTKNDDFTLSLLTNADVLALLSGSRGGRPVYRTQEECVWLASRADGRGHYAALFNLGDTPREVCVPLAQLDICAQTARELWTKREHAPGDALSARLGAHDAALFLLT